MGVVGAENSDYSKNDGKNKEKDNKFKKKSYIPCLRVGLDGDVDSQPRRKPPKLGQLKLKKKTIGLLCTCTSGIKGEVKCHNHFKIEINGQELLHYRSGELRSIFVDVQNPCLLHTTLR